MANRSGVSSQNISRTDILAEGPVRGLKNGSSSIFFNDVAAEDAVVRGYNPVEGTASGKITFNGTSLTNTSVSGATLPLNLVNPTGVPRQLVLKNYKTANVTVSVASSDAAFTTATCTATSGAPFTTDWNTQQDYKSTAYLKADGVLIKGQFSQTSSTVGSFLFNGLSDTIDTTETYELRIAVGFFIDTINSSTSLTLKSSYSGYSGATPAAGTYFFEVPPLVSSPRKNQNGGGFPNKIEGIEVEFRPGHRYQDPLNEIGGVGGSIAATTSVNHELKVIGTGEIAGISPVPEDGKIGSTMESGLPLDSQDDVANDATVLNDTAFGITAAQRPEVDEISLRITYPGGLQYINSQEGKRSTSYARYLIQIQTTLDNVDSEWENAFPGSYVGHQGRTNAAYSFDHVLGLNQYRPFDSFKIRVIRLTRHIGLRVEETGHGNGVTNREKWTLIAKSKIDQLGYVIKDRLSYPYTSLISTSFSSKQYQEPPKMSYLMQGLKVKVPNTYTPREYTSDGVAKYEEFWDGTFKNELQYTDNPAWVFYDIVTNNRYGAGRWIKESDIDKYALYRIAKYCDELVDNGAGGTEPRFRSNIFLTKATDVYKVLKDFASAFTGMLYWMDGRLTPVQDSPSDPVYNFTKGNVIDGKFGYESSGTKTRSNQVIVTWNDPKSNYEPVPLIVEDREAIIRDKRIITEEVVAFGCTSEAQAIRYGRWKLWTAQKQTEVVSFKSALNSLYIKPGDTINVQDADRDGVQYSGRVSFATSASVTLDRSVTLNSGSTYTLSTLVTEPAAFYVGADNVTINGNTYSRGDRLPEAYVYDTVNDDGTYDLEDLDTEDKASNAFDDTSGTNLLPIVWKNYSYIQENTVTNSAGTVSTLTVSSFEFTPSTNTIWALKEVRDNLTVVGSSKKYKVLSINQDKSNEYGFSAVEHFDEKYTYVDSGYVLAELDPTIYQETEPRDGETEMPAPSNLRLILETDATRPGEEFKLEWDPSTSDFVDLYEVYHNIEDTDNPIRTPGTFIRLTNVPNGSITFNVRAVSTGGNYSRFINLSYVSLDPYGTNIERVQYGIPKGAITNSEAGITGSSGSEAFTFAKSSFAIASNGDKETILTPNENSQDVSDIPADENYYVFLDADTPTLKLMYYDTESLENMPFWRDAGTGNSASSTSWTSIGSVLIAANDNTVFGTGFNTNVELRDILNLSGSTSPTSPLGEGAVVISILSDTQLLIDRTFDTQIATTGYRANYRPDYEQDAAVARVHKNSSNVFTAERFLVIDPSLESTTRSLTFDLDVQNLTYDKDSTQTNVPSSINASVRAIGYREPEFKIVIPSGMSAAGTQDFALSTGSDTLLKEYVLDNDGAIDYSSGSPLTIVASVREANDPANTVKSSTIVLTKSKDGGTGQTGRVVNLTMGDQTFEYNTEGASPSPSSTTVTATAVNTSGTVYYEFLKNGTQAQAPGTSNTYTYTPPSSYASMPETIEVRIREGSASNPILARDQITVSGLRAGSDAATVILSNEAHTLYTTNTGTVTYTGSGTDIEVWEGTNQVPYDGSAPYQSPSFRVSISSDTGITANSSPSTVSTYIRRYGDHNSMTTDTASIVYNIIVKNSAGAESTFTKTQSFAKSEQGAPGAPGDPGDPGVQGERGEKVITGYLYYYQAQSSAPTVPATSILSVNWSTGAVSSSSSAWAIQPPTFEAGSTNTYWYFTFTAAESGTYNSATDSYSTTTVTFNPAAGQSAVKGIGFQNLVTFSSLTAQGTTTIDGSRITTGQIDAQRLNVTQINVGDLVNNVNYQTQAVTSSAQINVTQTTNYVAPPTQVSQLTNNAGYQTQAFTNPGQINVTQTLNYVPNPTQVGQLTNNAGYQSGLTTLSQFSNATTQFQAGLEQLSQFSNDSGFQTAAFTQPGQINVTQTTNYVAPPTQVSQLTNNAGYQTQAVEFSATAISGGKIGLSTLGLIIGNNQVSIAANNSIILDTTQGNNAITIYDGTTARVKIGKLS